MYKIFKNIFKLDILDADSWNKFFPKMLRINTVINLKLYIPISYLHMYVCMYPIVAITTVWTLPWLASAISTRSGNSPTPKTIDSSACDICY